MLVTYGKFLVEFYIGLAVLWALLMGVGFLMLGGGGIKGCTLELRGGRR